MPRIIRVNFKGVPASPPRNLYGEKGPNILLAPLDICMDSSKPFPSLPAVSLVGAPVNTTGAMPIGDVASHDVPGLSGNIDPVVRINSNGALSGVPSGVSGPPGGVKGKKIELVVSNISYDGVAIDDVPISHPYITINHRVMAYQIKFDNLGIDESFHGGRVYWLNGTNKLLLGMLISTQGQDALVYPAHLI